MKLLTLVAFLFLFGCGKIKVKTGAEFSAQPINNGLLNPIDSKQARFSNKQNQELDIYNYDTMTVSPSGMYYQAVLSPLEKDGKFLTPSGTDQQAHELFVVYKSRDMSSIGGIDIINISDKLHPYLLKSFESNEYDFIDVKLKDNYAFILGESSFKRETILLVFDFSSLDNPLLVYQKNFLNEKALNLDKSENKLTIYSDMGWYTFDISNPNQPSLSNSEHFSIFSGTFSILYNLVLDSVNNSIFSIIFNSSPSLTKQIPLNNSVETSSRMVRQNSLVYLNNENLTLSIFDISQTLKNKPIETLNSTNLYGESKGISFDQQKIYLAQGSEGSLIAESLDEPTSVDLKGKLIFNEQTDTDKVWVAKQNSFKFVLFNDNNVGLKFISEDYVYQSSPNIKILARGQNNLSVPAIVLIKVNGQDFQTITLNNTAYELFSLNFSRPLTAQDKVESILLSPQVDQSAFISYVNVNNHYCYQEVKNGSDNTGLLSHLQTIQASQDECETYQTIPLCTMGALKVPPETCNLANNRLGNLTCDTTQMGYTCEDSGLCQSGYALANGICEAVICTPSSIQDCSDSISIRNQTCNSSGTGYGACNLISCFTGFSQIGGQCIANLCTPMSFSGCSMPNGSGLKQCSSDGTSFGSCSLVSCDSGYYNDNGNCVSQTCSPNSTQSCVTNNHFTGTRTCNPQGSAYGSCSSSGSCESGYVLNAGSCNPQACSPFSTISCNENNGQGQKTCDSSGTGYGSCILSNCDSGYHFNGSSCLQQICSPSSTQNCSVTNGSGFKTCSSDGLSYGNCIPSGCNSGYTLIGGICVQQICSPNSTVFCSSGNGSGSKTCDSQGLNYGNCILTTCDSGYYFSGGSCIAQTCSPNSTQSCSTADHFSGTRTCNSQGSAYGSCVAGLSCENGYYNNNGICSPQICSPSSTQSCSITNGTGSQTCAVNGSTWGSCSVNSCNSGYYNNGSSCSAQICTPNSTMSCINNHYIGSQTCNAQGSGYGSCQTGGTCEAGYYNNGSACVPQVCSPNSATSCSISNGVGSKTCSSDGSGYGSCSITSCNSGYYDNGTNCVAQTCSPNSTTSCSIANGSGTKTCNSMGSAYGSCSPSSCNSGYHLGSGTCDPNTISCSITNGTGSQIWNSGTQSYGTCTVTSCISDAYQSGNSCVLYCPNPLLIHVIIGGTHLCL